MKKVSISMTIMEIQIKLTLRFYLTPVRRLLSRTQTTDFGNSVWEKKPSYTVGGNGNYHNHYENSMEASQKNKKRTAI
jgi:hypothetical protein